jgi:molybdate transport system ATP-binding protein
MRDGKIEAAGSAVDVLSRPSISSDRREAGAVLEGVVEKIDAYHRIAVVTLRSARLYVPEIRLSAGKAVRVRIPSRDVILATVRPEGLSALNILEGTIRQILPAEDGTVEIQIDCGGDIILSRITAFSCERLGLEAERAIFAVIKTVALEP